MICCMCGEAIEPGDVFIRVTQHRVTHNLATGRDIEVQEQMEDGTYQKIAHPLCPALLSHNVSALVGADGDRDAI